jgi:urea carboxylase
MFQKVLIANRGAIACRIIRTLRRMGIASVAVHSDADRHALHVEQADEAYPIGPAPAAESYLLGNNLIALALKCGAGAIHPGYGFLSENAAFAEACADSGIAFIGPTPAQMRAFGLKHRARELAVQAGVPLLPGTGLLSGAEQAITEAARIGYPVMLKSTAGGGGIGMRLCRNDEDLRDSYAAVERLSLANFKDAGLYLEKYVERARHIEVQIFGDGQGNVIALGERDCSVQRRNQKIVEETPAPGLTAAQREELLAVAERLAATVSYQSAGTVEFVYDDTARQFYFLEVNTRLQVEHGVTEEVCGVDLVEWMVRCAAGELPSLASLRPKPAGASIQVRLYAEDPYKNFQPSAGLLTNVVFPAGARVDGWVRAGTEVTAFYDPLLAKLIVKADTREAAIARLQDALSETRLDGIETNLEYLRMLAGSEPFARGDVYTKLTESLPYHPDIIEILDGGTMTTVQDLPGRLGLWDVGVPPSGPMDALHFAAGNALLGNSPSAAGLECTLNGPTLRFAAPTRFVLSGARMEAALDGRGVPNGEVIEAPAGALLEMGGIEGPGARTYLLIGGGLDVPDYLGSKSTFTLGKFGGHGGRALRTGDILHKASDLSSSEVTAIPLEPITNSWELEVLYGPHGAPDFFTAEDIETFFGATWKVHYNSSRTGVRLIGPKPHWARKDGGEAGLHPSNIHDNAYAIGAVDFTGDMPVILGPDGPSLGGFVCPAVVTGRDLWKLGQLKAGDTVRFRALTTDEGERAPAILRTTNDVVYRQAGDRYLLIEYGDLVLDLPLRFRVQAVYNWFMARKPSGVIDVTPGIRSFQVHYDPAQVNRTALMDLIDQAEADISESAQVEVPSREVWLPLSWDDPATQEAINKYTRSVRPDAPWCPSNIEFIRRINGLDSIQDVYDTVFNASYLVLGLGDVYLGAPVATPLDPRHRLVTTKYNPARTWTAENSVGIGGAYLCVYGMEGPGGYQFVGRTIQMWNTYRTTREFTPGHPWLLRFFDRIRFYPVTASELLKMRDDFPNGRLPLRIEDGVFNLSEYQRFLDGIQDSAAAFQRKQRTAFQEERARWATSGLDQVNTSGEEVLEEAPAILVPPGSKALKASSAGSVWSVEAKEGDVLKPGQKVVLIEAMKMEVAVAALHGGTLRSLHCKPGMTVLPGQILAVIQP